MEPLASDGSVGRTLIRKTHAAGWINRRKTSEFSYVAQYQIRGSSLVRTILVASATMAILIVCFFIYQQGQDDLTVVVQDRMPQLPTVPDETFDLIDMAPELTDLAAGETYIGPGEKIHITLYPKEGSRAQLELAVTDWRPIAGTADEFVLTDPDVRMLTQDDHAVRITAKRGTLEARRKSGGGLEPLRGTLSGDVLIQYDRLTDKQRAALPEELRNEIDPADLVEMAVDKIEFDLEYSKLFVPGRLLLTAHEVRVDASNLEIRLDEAGSRVESVRMSEGGRIEFSDPSAAGSSPSEGGQLTLIEWLRSSLQAKLDHTRPVAPDAEAAEPMISLTDRNVPVFHPGTEEKVGVSKPPVRYVALIEGDVRATRLAGGEIRASLEADRLEIVRETGNEGRASGDASTAGKSATDDASRQTPQNRIVLEWSDRLFIEPCSVDDARCAEAEPSRITATGSPAKITLADGHALCSRLVYQPDDSTVQLYGKPDEPVVVRLSDQGTITGASVFTKRTADRLDIKVTGPGSLEQELARSTPAGASVSDSAAVPTTIRFSDELEVFTRYVTRTTLDATSGITSRKEQVLERAVFSGKVRMRQEDTGVDADRLELTFASSRFGASDRGRVKTVSAQGHVVMTQGSDQLTCREIDIWFTTDPEGRSVLQSATARGNVEARQSDRVIRARNKLIVDFTTIERSAPPFDPVGAYIAAVDAGLDVDTIDWAVHRRKHEAGKRRETRVKRLQAFGEVAIDDPAQPLTLRASELTCSVADGKDIQKAFVVGSEERPASIELETLSVTGREISVDVPRQRASVPGAGTLTFLSNKSLDGRKVADPVPVDVTWTDSMNYRGDENRAVFEGNVHASSRKTTTFDCDRLDVEFEDVPKERDAHSTGRAWSSFQSMLDGLRSTTGDDTVRLAARRVSKELTNILATGRAVAMTSDFDPVSGRLVSRSRIAGTKLWVNLRTNVSKMQIESPGTLLLEDYRPAAQDSGTEDRPTVGLFGVSRDSGPSNTLIEWNDLMWYDFSTNQTRFEGAVSLRHFSGSELMQIRRGLPFESAETTPGRATFLTSNALTVSFVGDDASADAGGRRIGGLSADRLQQFEATGSVILQDETEGLSVTADRIVYWNDRDVLAIYGMPERKAHIVIRKPGELPSQAEVERLFYNLRTGEMELSRPTLRSR